mgnify:CR=1 FL=1
MEFSKQIAKAALDIKAIKLNPNNPFQWASGYRMPIYNDNRMLLFYPHLRRLMVAGFEYLVLSKKISYDVIAGTFSAGYPPGILLAERVGAPFIYVRDKPKDHGLKNQREGIGADQDLDGKNVLLIEDLISTGGSSIKGVQAIRQANGKCVWCLSIFNYGFEESNKMFADLTPPCNVLSLLTYDTLLEVAMDVGYMNERQIDMLQDWRKDPFNWGEKNGFPKVEKK